MSEANEGFGGAQALAEACFEKDSAEKHEVRYPSDRCLYKSRWSGAEHSRQYRRYLSFYFYNYILVTMSTLRLNPEYTDAELDQLGASLSHAPKLHGPYVQAATGECGQVFVGPNFIAKLTHANISAHDSANLLSFETEIVIALSENDCETPPLIVPSLEDGNYAKPPYYTVFSRVPGNVLLHEEIRLMTPREQTAMGEKMAAFIDWMGRAIKTDKYEEIYNLYERPEIFSRESFIKHAAQMARLRDNLPADLSKLLYQSKDELLERNKDGSLAPSIIGHDDLRSGNLTFDDKMDDYRLIGVFDFGLTKPSSPERELRHLAMFPAALEAAIGTYEDKSESKIDSDLLRFWAIGQTATNLAYAIWNGNEELMVTKYLDLRTIVPAFTLS